LDSRAISMVTEAEALNRNTIIIASANEIKIARTI
jgi:hypothetical protein